MALYHVEKREDGFTLGVWEIRETEEELRRLCFLSDKEFVALTRIQNEKRRKEFLAVRVLKEELLGVEGQIVYEKNGRPYLKNSSTEISIAHTRRFAVLCLHPQKRLGVDVESLERNFSEVEHRALSQQEVFFLSREKRSLHLAIMWCIKEALYKCIPQDNVVFSEHIQIEPFVPQESGALYAHFSQRGKSCSKHFMEYKTIDNHIIVCTY